MTDDKLETYIEEAAEAENWALVDNLCRREIESGRARPFHWYWLSKTAMAIGAEKHARRYANHAAKPMPDDERLPDLLRNLETKTRLRPEAGINPRYLVIRELGGGFWADVLCTLCYLHIAEYTNRTPITFWGPASRFTDDDKKDAFGNFFEPVSGMKMHDLPGKLAGVFPERWSRIPIAASRPRSPQLGWYPVYLPRLLFRPEQLVVGDFFCWPIELFAWTQNWTRLAPARTEALCRQLWQKYVRPRPEFSARADAIWQSFEGDPNIVAVHVRATDKAFETAEIKSLQREALSRVTALLQEDSKRRVLVLTDSERHLAKYRRHFGGRMLSTPARRSDNDTGIHFMDVESRHELGADVLVDVLLACRCERFIGLAPSNVSQAVRFMKDWTPDRIDLLGDDIYARRHVRMHDPEWQKAQHKTQTAKKK